VVSKLIHSQRWLISLRTATTTKAAAFAAPQWAYETEEVTHMGENSLTKEEILLAETYEQLERPDLAECVRGGRRYHRLDSILTLLLPYHGEEMTLGHLTSLTRAFLGEETPLPDKLDDWIVWAKGFHNGNPDLEAVSILDEQIRAIRLRNPKAARCETGRFIDYSVLWQRKEPSE
jgi:hypothetical protein